uniref:Homeobox-leucine zipper protein ROC2 n=1 Tax=Ananas comosus var. bracteatus TaxID=296719 RepID=A0A6V7NXW6_ANACO|nr:unnamed protein product [Ananas comosus var. bracteatus]
MPTGIMIPARNVPSMIGRSNGVAYGSSSALSLGQVTKLGGGQQIPLQNQHHQLVDIPQSVVPEGEMVRPREEDFESKSGSENIEGAASGDDQDPNQRPRKKRYHRHTQHQIQELEAFFKECPHPDDKQRKELSRELGLEPLQVKFWFQNKRTQMKTQHERHENTQLRADNEKLRAENMRYKEALSNASCPNCGGPAAIGEMSFDEHHLRIENARLREEIDRISGIAAKYVGKPMTSSYPLLSNPNMSSRSPLDLGVGGGFGVQPGIGIAAMEELIRMAQLGEPLWTQGLDGLTETLNEDEYVRAFPRGIGPKQFGLKSEASRDTSVVIMNHINLVEILMDVNQWSTVFSGIVSRAITLEVLSTGVAGNYNGALQVMSAEFQVPSPLVQPRMLFVRYCKQHADGTWAVVDVSLDSLRPSPVMRCRRRPRMLDPRNAEWLLKGDLGGARRSRRQVGSRHIQALSEFGPRIRCEAVVITTPEGRKSMLKLAERMVISFCGGVTASTTHQWTTLSGSGAEDVRVMTRKSIDDPGRPPGIVLNAATSFWLPVSPKRVFDFLRDESSLDILSNGGIVQEMAHIANGRDHGNCVSLLRVNSANSNQSNMLILQESCTDATGSYVIYAPVDVVAMNVVLNGGDPDYVALLPRDSRSCPTGRLQCLRGGQRTVSAAGDRFSPWHSKSWSTRCPPQSSRWVGGHRE